MEMGKKDKLKATLLALNTWCDLYEESKEASEDDEDFEDVLRDLDNAAAALAQKARDLAEHSAAHSGFDYYDVNLGDRKFKMARCKNCGKELAPRGASRHYKSPACEKDRQRRLGK